MNWFWWAVLTAFVWGMVPILEKIGLSGVEPFTALFFRCFGVILGIIMLSVFVVRPDQIRSVDIKTIGILVLAGFLASFVANIAFYHALKLGEVSRVVPISGTYHLVAFLLGILIFKEALTVQKIIGVILIVSGVWFLK